MKYRDTCVLLPCHSLEDFPLHYTGDDADGLLAAWTTLWHPTLLAQTGVAPHWFRGNTPPQDLADRLILAPGVSLSEVPVDFAQRAAAEGAWYIPGNHPRDALLRRALEPLAGATGLPDADLASDFLALGYAYLQVELLTRQMRYSTNLDEIHFFQQVTAGAQAAVTGDQAEARARLTACFDLLAQERDHYYAVDAYVLDVALLAAHTLGEPLLNTLSAQLPLNVIVEGHVLASLRESHPDALQALRQGLERGKVALVGGDHCAQRTPLLGCETMLRQLQLGLRACEDALGQRPHVYGRRRFGLSVLHPQLLYQLGYVAALHMTFDQGRAPEGTQRKIRWQGPDHSALDSLHRAPLDAARPETFLALARKLSETMDMDHVATLCLAHWPGHASTWYDDLRRVARYGNMLGKFVTADAYFRDTSYPGSHETFQADQYQSPYLVQAAERNEVDAISTSIRYWRRYSQAAAVRGASTLAVWISQRPPEEPHDWLEQIDLMADEPDACGLEQPLQHALEQLAGQIAQAVPRRTAPPEPGVLVINPCSFARRVALDLPQLPHLPATAPPVYAAADDQAHRYVLADVPSMGFAWISGGSPATLPRRAAPVLAAEHHLGNEYLEATIHPETGALLSLHEYEKRGNLLSQQIALRTPGPGERPSATYSTMKADRVHVTAANPVLGEITAQGALLDPSGTVVARFEQRYRLWRGSRILQVHIRIDPIKLPTGNPWNSYYACRFAWGSESAMLWRTVNQVRQRAEAKRFEAPNYVLIDDGDRNVVIVTGGLPFHRRTDPRMLDSLLIVPGERQREFSVGVGINVKHPLHESLDFLTPPLAVYQEAPPPAVGLKCWLLHVDHRNILATHWEPMMGDDGVRGFRARLLETAGRTTRAKLHTFRPLTAARRVDFRGQSLGACTLDGGSIVLDMKAHQWIQVEATW